MFLKAVALILSGGIFAVSPILLSYCVIFFYLFVSGSGAGAGTGFGGGRATGNEPMVGMCAALPILFLYLTIPIGIAMSAVGTILFAWSIVELFI